MAKAAKAPAKKTNPVFVAGGVGLAAIAWLVLNPGGGDAGATTPAKSKTRSAAKDASGLTEADFKAAKNPFPPVVKGAVDAFNPLIKTTVKSGGAILPSLPADGTAGMVPASLTGGEANWYFTGAPQLNGVTQAVLENTTTSESVVLQPGQSFKSARIQSVDVSTVVLVGQAGKAVSVPIQAYGEMPGGGRNAVASNAPLPFPGIPLSGPIGARPGAIAIQPATGPQSITLSNGQTLQMNPTDPIATDPNAQGNGRRRRRRNNPNSGDPNNGL